MGCNDVGLRSERFSVGFDTRELEGRANTRHIHHIRRCLTMLASCQPPPLRILLTYTHRVLCVAL